MVKLSLMDNKLVPYRRHLKSCKHKSKGQNFWACSCPIWAYGQINDKRVRRATGLRDWARAVRKIEQWLDDPEQAKSALASEPTVSGAVKAYLTDCESRSLAAETLRQYAIVLEHLERFTTARGILRLAALDVAALTAFRNARAGEISTGTQVKELHAISVFLGWCIEQGITEQNPAKKVKPPKHEQRPTLPFERDEVALMIRACDGFGREGNTEEARRRATLRARALLLLLLYSGLRLSDAALLRRDRLNLHSRKMLLRTEKTGAPVYLTLHADAVAALAALPAEGPYFFWSGKGKKTSHFESCRRTFDRILKRAGVNGHPHRFRDTFAVELLLQGVDIRTVQRLLGHQSLRTTEKFYAPYVAAFQAHLDAATAKLDFSSGTLTAEAGEHALGDPQGNVLPFVPARDRTA